MIGPNAPQECLQEIFDRWAERQPQSIAVASPTTSLVTANSKSEPTNWPAICEHAELLLDRG